MLTTSNTVFHALHESRYLHNILIKYINAFRKLQSLVPCGLSAGMDPFPPRGLFVIIAHRLSMPLMAQQICLTAVLFPTSLLPHIIIPNKKISFLLLRVNMINLGLCFKFSSLNYMCKIPFSW